MYIFLLLSQIVSLLLLVLTTALINLSHCRLPLLLLLPLLPLSSEPKAVGRLGHLVSLPGSPMSFQMGLLGGEALLPGPRAVGTHLSSGLQSAEGRPEAGQMAALSASRMLSVLRTLHWACQEGAIREREPGKLSLYNPALGVGIIESLLPRFVH